MGMSLEEELGFLTEKCRRLIRSGQIDQYAGALKEMGGLFLRAERFTDQLRIHSLAFYIDLSGFGRFSHIDRDLIAQLQIGLSRSKTDIKEFEGQYFAWIQPDMIPQHVMSVKDSWYLLRLCLSGKIEQADRALERI